MVDRGQKSTNASGEKDDGIDRTIVIVAGILAALQFNAATLADTMGIQYCEEKMYGKSFEKDFFPFYMSQHQDDTCVKFHLLATTFIILYCAYDYRLGVSLAVAVLAGLVVKEFLRSQSTGLVEMAVMQGMYFWAMRQMKETTGKAATIPVVGYGLAWVGHFFFEHNKPATFIYPVFSFLADFRMFFGHVFKYYGQAGQ